MRKARDLSANTPMNQDPILAVATRAARRAGSVIADAARDLKRLPAHAKGHEEIAAAADAEAAKAISATLGAAFPAHAILGEERAAAKDAPYRWIFDPIVGRTNFLHGFPYYAVSIALMHGEDLTHAVVLDPLRDELFMAIGGGGAQLNGTPIRVSACTHLDGALLGTAFPGRDSTRMAACMGIFGTLIARCAGIRPAGACALDLAHLAAGRLDGFWATSVVAREVAAGALIVSEAGGRVGDLAGAGTFLHASGLIAAAPGIFNPLRETVAAAAPA
jgi:myo-inositol-1(or 4)-monophosphatase